MKRRREPVSSEKLAAYLEGEVTVSERALLEAELAECSESGRRLEQLRQIRQALSAPATEVEEVDLTSAVQQALHAAKGSAPRAVQPLAWRSWWALGAAAAFAGGVFALTTLDGTGSAEFRSKADSATSSAAERWAGIRAHRIPAGGEPEPLAGELAVDDGLVFSYTNLGPEPFGYLMIFAIGAAGEVYWFYPAYERAGTDPVSMAIAPGVAELRLPDAIRHEYASGALTIHGFFTRRPWRVSEVEAQFGGEPTRREAPAGTRLYQLEARVVP